MEISFEKIIFGVAVLLGLLLFRQTKLLLLKVILIGLAICYVLSFFPDYIDINIAFFGFGLLTFGFTFWSGIERRWIVMLIGLFAFLSFSWSYLNLEFWGLLQFLMIIPLGCYAWALYKRRAYHQELSVLTVIAGFELTEFLLFVFRIGGWIVY